MGNKKLLLLLIIFLYIACNYKESEKKINISKEFSEKWKKDSLGCLGYRVKYVKDSLNVIENFIGTNYNIFVENFGNSYISKKNDDNSIVYMYWISCSIAPPIKNLNGITEYNLEEINSEATRMNLKVNNKNLIQAVNIIMP